MRLFVAIPMPDEVKKYIFSLRDNISIQGSITKAKDTHLTLKFLGEVQEDKVDEIINRLKNVKFNNFKIYLDHIGFFPNDNYFKVWWIGIKPEEQINELQQLIDNSLIQFFPKEKDFKPHLTFARIKFIKNKDEFLKQIKNIKIEPLEINVDRFLLMKSTLTGEGPIYEEIKSFEANS